MPVYSCYAMYDVLKSDYIISDPYQKLDDDIYEVIPPECEDYKNSRTIFGYISAQDLYAFITRNDMHNEFNNVSDDEKCTIYVTKVSFLNDKRAHYCKEPSLFKSQSDVTYVSDLDSSVFKDIHVSHDSNNNTSFYSTTTSSSDSSTSSSVVFTPYKDSSSHHTTDMSDVYVSQDVKVGTSYLIPCALGIFTFSCFSLYMYSLHSKHNHKH
jgi:hypothetical protein